MAAQDIDRFKKIYTLTNTFAMRGLLVTTNFTISFT